ncbi:MAG: monooxygenase [Deltaproteobacteria bacterium]|nr:monooxygenase [Kofleriaceae bacterium]
MRLAFLLALAPIPACFYSTESPLPADFATCEAPPEPGVAPAAPTYYRDVKPIVDRTCAGCHIADGVAPFPLTTYAEVELHKHQAQWAVEHGVMPPWQPADCCNDYRDDRSLSPDEIATFTAWVTAGAPEGDPADEPPAPPPAPDRLPRVDVDVQLAAPFTPSPRVGKDEIRCFLLPHTFVTATYVTGTDLIPSNRRIAHHAIIVAVSNDKARELARKDGADGRPGWDCYGGADELDARGTIGGWQPGDSPRVFPDGVGAEVKPGTQLLLQMHYDTGAGAGADQPRVQLMLSDTVERVARGAPVGNPLWFAGEGMEIRAGDPDAMVFFSYDPTRVLGKGGAIDVESVMIHMHELGTIGRLAILRADGTTECLLNILDWDFHWMTTYFLARPVRIHPGDRLYVECHWDNTRENQKLVNGEPQEPRTIGWGADEEMCGGIIGFSEPVARGPAASSGATSEARTGAAPTTQRPSAQREQVRGNQQ